MTFWIVEHQIDGDEERAFQDTYPIPDLSPIDRAGNRLLTPLQVVPMRSPHVSISQRPFDRSKQIGFGFGRCRS